MTHQPVTTLPKTITTPKRHLSADVGTVRTRAAGLPPSEQRMSQNPTETPPSGAFKPDRLVYHVNDACRVLGGISRANFYNMVAARKIRLVRVAGRSVVTADDLVRFVQGV